MPRADINVTKVTREGVLPAGVVGQADGHMFRNSGAEFIEVSNTEAATGSTRTLTIPTPRKVDGLDVADVQVAIPPTERRLIGPFPPGTFNQPSSSADRGKVYLNYAAAAEASFLVRVFTL